MQFTMNGERDALALAHELWDQGIELNAPNVEVLAERCAIILDVALLMIGDDSKRANELFAGVFGIVDFAREEGWVNER